MIPAVKGQVKRREKVKLMASISGRKAEEEEERRRSRTLLQILRENNTCWSSCLTALFIYLFIYLFIHYFVDVSQYDSESLKGLMARRAVTDKYESLGKLRRFLQAWTEVNLNVLDMHRFATTTSCLKKMPLHLYSNTTDNSWVA